MASKNPLRELLNRIKYDSGLDQSFCHVSYSDRHEKKLSRDPLILCSVQSRNILAGDSIVPYHRIKSVSYGSVDVYPFDGSKYNLDQKQKIKDLCLLRQDYYVLRKLPGLVSEETILRNSILFAKGLDALAIKIGELAPGIVYPVTGWIEWGDNYWLHSLFDIKIDNRKAIFFRDKYELKNPKVADKITDFIVNYLKNLRDDDAGGAE